ncbi:MAG: YlmC/YmxH family sporulation protein [Clostridia bacterium]|nr:YlmC/YmxH family sporulation protein [Clostridia bacterium]
MKNQRILDLSYKEVIHLQTGQRLGYVRDAEIDPETGRVTALIIPGRLKWLGLLGREPETVIPWDSIHRLGEDIIFVGKKPALDREGTV